MFVSLQVKNTLDSSLSQARSVPDDWRKLNFNGQLSGLD